MRDTSRVIYTTCRYCESSCGLAVEVDVGANRVVRIKADKENPGSWRDVCNKGLTANEVVEHPRRLRSPMKRVGQRYVPVGYEEAVTACACARTLARSSCGRGQRQHPLRHRLHPARLGFARVQPR